MRSFDYRTMAEIHRLSIHCRVCGERVQRAKKKDKVHSCRAHKDSLSTTFHINVDLDCPGIHPTSFCNFCYAAMARNKVAQTKGKQYKHTIEVFEWSSHIDGNCKVGKLERANHTNELEVRIIILN